MFTKNVRFLCASSALAAFAQPQLPKGYHWQKLYKGLEAVVIEPHKVPLVTVEIAVKKGAYTKGPEHSGLLHWMKHVFFKADIDNSDEDFSLKRTKVVVKSFAVHFTTVSTPPCLPFGRNALRVA